MLCGKYFITRMSSFASNMMIFSRSSVAFKSGNQANAKIYHSLEKPLAMTATRSLTQSHKLKAMLTMALRTRMRRKGGLFPERALLISFIPIYLY